MRETAASTVGCASRMKEKSPSHIAPSPLSQPRSAPVNMNFLQVPFQKLRIAGRSAGMHALMAGAADRHQLEEELITHMGISQMVDFRGPSLLAPFAGDPGPPQNALAHGLPVSRRQIAAIDSPPLRLPFGDGRFPALPVGVKAAAEAPLVELLIPLRAPLAVGDAGVRE